MQASQPETALGIEDFSGLTLDDPVFTDPQLAKDPASPCSVYSDYGSIPDEDLINIDSNGNAPQAPIDNAFTHQAVSRDSSNAGLIDDDLRKRLEGVFRKEVFYYHSSRLTFTSHIARRFEICFVSCCI